MMWASLLLMVVAVAEANPIDIEAYLVERPALVELHRGYLTALSSRPDLREAETQYWKLLDAPQLAAHDAAFDEALQQDPAAQALFFQFYDGLHRDGDARQAYEQLQHVLAEEGERGLDLAEAMTAWQADPAAALRFFNTSDGGGLALPPAVRELLPYLRRRPELLGELGGLFQTSMNSVHFDERVLPWWKHVAPFDAKHNGAARNLTQYFLEHPEAFRTWHRRQSLLAADAQLRSWIHHWRRVVRRDGALREAYGKYVAANELQLPGGVLIEAVDWPPKTAPPALEPHSVLPASASSESRLKTKHERHIGLDRTRPRRPEMKRPEVSRPALPTKPGMPNLPVKPVKPVKPERQEGS